MMDIIMDSAYGVMIGCAILYISFRGMLYFGRH